MPTAIWAHRGASAYAPENTLEAIELALRMGADGIELDVHRTRDGKLVVIHDETVDRTSNGSGYVKDMTCAELKKLDFSNGFEKYRGARIPTLKEVYGMLRSTQALINVEIKCTICSWNAARPLLRRELGFYTGRRFTMHGSMRICLALTRFILPIPLRYRHRDLLEIAGMPV